MTNSKLVVLVSFLMLNVYIQAQQSATYTNDLVAYQKP